MEIRQVQLSVPPGYQLILGQSHFIKTVEDLYETLVSSMPGIKFGVSFCESSGKALIRYDGTDDDAKGIAIDFATRLSAGHTFVVILKDSYPINILSRVKAVEEVVNVYCATANSVTVILAEIEDGKGILGVVDGVASKGVESEADKLERSEFLRRIGYKR
ncbi:MAG: adenosine-specific kinase [Nitrososphaerales archaeon]|jgi:adenosine/AMP kinase